MKRSFLLLGVRVEDEASEFLANLRAFIQRNRRALNRDGDDGIAHLNPVSVVHINRGILAFRAFLWGFSFSPTATPAVVHVRRVETAEVAQSCERWIHFQNEMVARDESVIRQRSVTVREPAQR